MMGLLSSVTIKIWIMASVFIGTRYLINALCIFIKQADCVTYLGLDSNIQNLMLSLLLVNDMHILFRRIGVQFLEDSPLPWYVC